MKRNCPECGEEIKGRADKKFCSDMCRNAHNNKLNSDTNNYVRNVNNILRKNRRVLEELLPGDMAKTNRSKLLAKGFDFNYYTGSHTTQKGDTYYYCYEFGYLKGENDFILLVKRRESAQGAHTAESTGKKA
jgi:hypothetical protein